MQSIFRLPWASEITDKPVLDKMRPTNPVVEIPPAANRFNNNMKRKQSGAALDIMSPHMYAPIAKKPRTDVAASPVYPLQLPTPVSPRVDVRFLQPKAEPPQQSPAPLPLTPADTTASSPVKAQTPSRPNVELPVTDWQQPAPSGATSTGAAAATLKQERSTPQAEAQVKPSLQHQQPQQQQQTTDNMESRGTVIDDSLKLTRLKQVIETEFNMQILMKHNEVRLIEQELAKCQVALEQLRRCELRPYPGSNRAELSVSEGTGPAVQKPGFSRPSHAAPYGVTDGPYSRHYANWLLKDPLFDPAPLSHSKQAFAKHAESVPDSGKMSTRNNGHARKSGSKSLGFGTRASEPQDTAMLNCSAAVSAREKPSFQVLRRSTDNQLVKLVCKDCRRSNFNSIQGFINHCRIAHKVEYKSHDSAAIDCGELFNEHELAALPTEVQALTAPKPKPKPTPTRAASVAVPNNKSFVHPFNTSGGLPTPAPSVGTRTAPQSPAVPIPPNRVAGNPPCTTTNITPFKPSAQAPRLSAFFAKHSLGGDLDQATANAKQKVDIQFDDDVSPLTPDATSPSFTGGLPWPRMQDSNIIEGSPRPSSRKGHRQPVQRPRPAPLAPSLRGMHNSALSSPQEPISAALSPNGADSNPGLVSDHEDDDHASDGESSSLELPPARHVMPTVGRTCEEDPMDLDIQEDDEIGSRGLIIRRNSMVAEDARAMRTPGSPSRQMGGK